MEEPSDEEEMMMAENEEMRRKSLEQLREGTIPRRVSQLVSGCCLSNNDLFMFVCASAYPSLSLSLL